MRLTHHPSLRTLFAVIGVLLTSLLPSLPARAAVPPIVTDLIVTADVRTQAGSPDTNFDGDFLRFISRDGHRAFARFDLLALPANAVIDSAELQLTFVSELVGPNDVEIGRANGTWDEATLTWNTQPAITAGGPVQTVTANGVYIFNVTPLVQAWHAGTIPNDGFGMRGNGGQQVAAHAKETGVGPKLVVTYRQPVFAGAQPDLGDAPDGTNHAGAAMAAYAATPASFPTVSDPATGLPQGPRHRSPLPFHLGPQASREAEADIGPDQDPLNNIVPPANDPDNDRFDDGGRPDLWNLTNCQPTTVPVRVFISPQAAAWFQSQNKKGFLNVWLDGNRDGDWADGLNCAGGQAAVEHIVIDQPIDVVALGAGLHIVNLPTRPVPWPAQLAQRPSWARVTLSERESNRTLQFGTLTYGDGRGYAQPFQTGETEDYLAHPEGVPGSPDLAVHLDGRLRHEDAGEQAAFTIEYVNGGARLASGGTLIFKKPAQLRDIPIALRQTPGILAADIVDTGAEIRFRLPALQPGAGGAITLRWAAFPSSVTGDLTAGAQVALSGDSDAANNQATATVARTAAAPIVGIKAGGGKTWALNETTCRNTVDLTGRGTPGTTVDLLLDDAPAGSVVVNPQGSFFAQLQLADGRHSFATVAAGSTGRPPTGTIIVDSGLPIDPLSLSFTDGTRNTFHPSTLGFSFGASNPSTFLRRGETYAVSIDSCTNDPNTQVSLSIIGVLIALFDDNDDGRYTGSFTYNPPAKTSVAMSGETAQFTVRNGGTVQSFALQLNEATGIVRDATTNQPLAEAAITALAAQPGNTSAWPAAALGQPNPQTTGTDGSFVVNLPGGANRLEVTRAGYQPYRSLVFDENSGVPRIALTPVISAAPTHRIYLTATGFSPAVLRAPTGSVIEWVNLSLNERSVTGGAWDSGALEPGQSYRTTLNAPGSSNYTDPTSSGSTATIVAEARTTFNRLYLPLASR